MESQPKVVGKEENPPPPISGTTTVSNPPASLPPSSAAILLSLIRIRIFQDDAPAQMELFHHVTTCSDSSCMFPSCLEGKQALVHFDSECKNPQCAICFPARLVEGISSGKAPATLLDRLKQAEVFLREAMRKVQTRPTVDRMHAFHQAVLLEAKARFERIRLDLYNFWRPSHDEVEVDDDEDEEDDHEVDEDNESEDDYNSSAFEEEEAMAETVFPIGEEQGEEDDFEEKEEEEDLVVHHRQAPPRLPPSPLQVHQHVAKKRRRVFDGEANPQIGGILIDRKELLLQVEKLGGFDTVCETRSWQTIRKSLGLPYSTSSGTKLRAVYLRFLRETQGDVAAEEEEES